MTMAGVDRGRRRALISINARWTAPAIDIADVNAEGDG